jgi:5-methylthioadenosine/S-adenosylhomocysteine deaminase
MAMKVTHIAQNYLHGGGVLPPDALLQMATENGARALRWQMGRLAAGQLADFILLDASGPHLRPLVTRPRSNVVFEHRLLATGADVDSSVVDGRVVMEKRRVLTMDETEVISSLQRRAQSRWERAGVGWLSLIGASSIRQ